VVTTRRIGILTCERCRSCAAGKCLRALRRREGAFGAYQGEDVVLVGLASCGGCPGVHLERATAEMKENGAEIVHLATGLVDGVAPCPHLGSYLDFARARFGLRVVVGTHPIPETSYRTHRRLGTWSAPERKALLEPLLAEERLRREYDAPGAEGGRRQFVVGWELG